MGRVLSRTPMLRVAEPIEVGARGAVGCCVSGADWTGRGHAVGVGARSARYCSTTSICFACCPPDFLQSVCVCPPPPPICASHRPPPPAVQVGNVVKFLLSDDASYITGQVGGRRQREEGAASAGEGKVTQQVVGAAEGWVPLPATMPQDNHRRTWLARQLAPDWRRSLAVGFPRPLLCAGAVRGWRPHGAQLHGPCAGAGVGRRAPPPSATAIAAAPCCCLPCLPAHFLQFKPREPGVQA